MPDGQARDLDHAQRTLERSRARCDDARQELERFAQEIERSASGRSLRERLESTAKALLAASDDEGELTQLLEQLLRHGQEALADSDVRTLSSALRKVLQALALRSARLGAMRAALDSGVKEAVPAGILEEIERLVAQQAKDSKSARSGGTADPGKREDERKPPGRDAKATAGDVPGRVPEKRAEIAGSRQDSDPYEDPDDRERGRDEGQGKGQDSRDQDQKDDEEQEQDAKADPGQPEEENAATAGAAPVWTPWGGRIPVASADDPVEAEAKGSPRARLEALLKSLLRRWQSGLKRRRIVGPALGRLSSVAQRFTANPRQPTDWGGSPGWLSGKAPPRDGLVGAEPPRDFDAYRALISELFDAKRERLVQALQQEPVFKSAQAEWNPEGSAANVHIGRELVPFVVRALNESYEFGVAPVEFVSAAGFLGTYDMMHHKIQLAPALFVRPLAEFLDTLVHEEIHALQTELILMLNVQKKGRVLSPPERAVAQYWRNEEPKYRSALAAGSHMSAETKHRYRMIGQEYHASTTGHFVATKLTDGDLA